MTKPKLLTWVLVLSGSIGCLTCGAFTIIPMFFGIGGNQVEHGGVAFDVHPNGDLIVFSSAKGELFTFHLKSKVVRKLAASSGRKFNPRFSPDGKAIVYIEQGTDDGGRLWTIPASGGSPKRLTTDSRVSDSGPCFSQDGKRVAFMRAARYRPYSMGGMVWDNFDVCILELASGKMRQLTHERYYGGGSAAFVDNCKAVVYAAMGHGEDLSSALYKVAADGSGKPMPFLPPPEPSPDIGAWASDVAFSRDARLITFISDRKHAYAYDVYVGEGTGKNLRPLEFTGISRYNQSPVFTPDGKSVLVLAGTEWNSHSRPIFSLYRITLNGKATKLADSGLFTAPGHWRPPE